MDYLLDGLSKIDQEIFPDIVRKIFPAISLGSRPFFRDFINMGSWSCSLTLRLAAVPFRDRLELKGRPMLRRERTVEGRIFSNAFHSKYFNYFAPLNDIEMRIIFLNSI